jgi:hypothetical protein
MIKSADEVNMKYISAKEATDNRRAQAEWSITTAQLDELRTRGRSATCELCLKELLNPTIEENA